MNKTLAQITEMAQSLPDKGQLKAIKVGKDRMRGYILVSESRMENFRKMLVKIGWHIIGE